MYIYGNVTKVQCTFINKTKIIFQLFHVVTGLETLFLLMFDSENQLKPAHLPLECHHGSSPSTCPHNDAQARYRCPTADEIKYRMTRVAIDALDIYLVESGTAINLWVIFFIF